MSVSIIVSFGYDIPAHRRQEEGGASVLTRPGESTLCNHDRGALRSRILGIVTSMGLSLVFQGDGVGIYDGQQEDSTTFVAIPRVEPTGLFAEAWADPDRRAKLVDLLRDSLATTVRQYRQDSLALTVAVDSTTFPGEGL